MGCNCSQQQQDTPKYVRMNTNHEMNIYDITDSVISIDSSLDNILLSTLRSDSAMNEFDEKENERREQLADHKQTKWVSAPTTAFLDDFIKVKQLGYDGQFGITYQCQRKTDGKYFAVKYLNKYRYDDKDIYKRYLYLKSIRNEVNILKRLNHDNIVKFEDIYEDKTTLYIVMEECNGGELFERIYHRNKYSECDAANIIKQILTALRYMHEERNIIHRDLKPENILFLTKEEDSTIKIIDFGLSLFVPPSKCLKTICGTPWYMAPEIIEKKGYNYLCDMWSVGVILYIMIYGYHPFEIDTKKEGIPALYAKIIRGFKPKIRSTSKYGNGAWFPDHIKTSKEVRDLITKLLQKNVDKRYTAKEALNHPWIVNMANKYGGNPMTMSRLIEQEGMDENNVINYDEFALKLQTKWVSG